MTEETFDLLVIGGGPAGFAAMVYGGRAGLKVHAIDEGMGGGQMAMAPLIENYPGYENILGIDLSEKMKAHALRYGSITEGYAVDKVSRTQDGFVAEGEGKRWIGKTLLIATGAAHRHLGVKGEKEFYGKGVSYCATCDGFFFKGKKVAVIGGGDSAIAEARYLLSIKADPVVIHRRPELRAERSNQDDYVGMGGKLLLSTVVEELKGSSTLESAVVRNTETGVVSEIPIQGAFVAIGYDPRSGLAKTLGARLDASGYIQVDRDMRTSAPGLLAAGDVTGGLKQIVCATYGGARAAMTAYEDLKKPYWLGK